MKWVEVDRSELKLVKLSIFLLKCVEVGCSGLK